ncbi:MAG: glycosyltransferase family 2 protein [Leptospiraceae bacterium]|nr:glycosyltransferase family 2 protein [Leptospiraceae bacterium]
MKSIPGLSACIITLNEEANLKDCLRSLDFASEIIVVDSGSSDDTCRIAERAGARVLHRQFDNYISQKNFAIEKARGPWILFLDADERVGDGLRTEIQDLLSKSTGEANSMGIQDEDGPGRTALPSKSPGSEAKGPTLPAGYRIPRITHYLGRWIRHSGWYPDYTIRLFQKGQGHFVGRTFHETVRVDGAYATLRNPILHFSYRDIREHLDIINRYSDLFAAERIAAGKKNGIFFSIGKALVKFLTMYFWKLGFLDGRVGLVIAILGAYYNFLKYIKVWETGRTGKKGFAIVEPDASDGREKSGKPRLPGARGSTGKRKKEMQI